MKKQNIASEAKKTNTNKNSDWSYNNNTRAVYTDISNDKFSISKLSPEWDNILSTKKEPTANDTKSPTTAKKDLSNLMEKSNELGWYRLNEELNLDIPIQAIKEIGKEGNITQEGIEDIFYEATTENSTKNLLSKLTDEQIKSIVLQTLNYTDNNMLGNIPIAALFSVCSDVLKEQLRDNGKLEYNFNNSLNKSKECILWGRSKYLEELDNLKENDNNSFLIAPLTSKNHLFCIVIYKINETQYNCIAINKGSRDFERGQRHIFESFIINNDNMENLCKLLVVKDIDMNIAYSTDNIYSVLDSISVKKEQLKNITAREQRVNNCLLKEAEEAIKYTFSVAFNEFEYLNIQGGLKVPKWPSQTQDMNEKFLQKILQNITDRGQDFKDFIKEQISVYSNNKNFRGELQQASDLSIEEKKTLLIQEFGNSQINLNNETNIKKCFQTVDLKTLQENLDLFRGILKENKILIPEVLERAYRFSDIRNLVADDIVKNNDDECITFLKDYFPHVLTEISEVMVNKYKELCIQQLNNAAISQLNNPSISQSNKSSYLKAKKLMDKAIELQPNNASLYVLRAQSKGGFNLTGSTYYIESFGDLKGAQEDYEKAYSLDKIENITTSLEHIKDNQKDAINKLNTKDLHIEDEIYCLQKIGKMDEALEKYTTLLEDIEQKLQNTPGDINLNKKRSEILDTMGMILEYQGKEDKRIQLMKKNTEVNYEWKESEAKKAQSSQEKQLLYKELKESIEQIIAKQPNDSLESLRAQHFLKTREVSWKIDIGDALVKEQKYDDALKQYNDILSTNTDKRSKQAILGKIANIYKKQAILNNDPAKNKLALDTYNDILSLGPVGSWRMEYMYAKIDLLRNLNDDETALSECENILDIEPLNICAISNKLDILIDLSSTDPTRKEELFSFCQNQLGNSTNRFIQRTMQKYGQEIHTTEYINAMNEEVKKRTDEFVSNPSVDTANKLLNLVKNRNFSVKKDRLDIILEELKKARESEKLNNKDITMTYTKSVDKWKNLENIFEQALNDNKKLIGDGIITTYKKNKETIDQEITVIKLLDNKNLFEVFGNYILPNLKVNLISANTLQRLVLEKGDKLDTSILEKIIEEKGTTLTKEMLEKILTAHRNNLTSNVCAIVNVIILEKEGQTQEALQQYDSLLKQDISEKSKEVIMNNMANIYSNNNQKQQALYTYEEILNLNGLEEDKKIIYTNKEIDILLDLGEYERALKICEHMIDMQNNTSLQSQNKKLFILDSWSKMDILKKEDALDFCKTILKEQPDNDIIRTMIKEYSDDIDSNIDYIATIEDAVKSSTLAFINSKNSNSSNPNLNIASPNLNSGVSNLSSVGFSELNSTVKNLDIVSFKQTGQENLEDNLVNLLRKGTLKVQEAKMDIILNTLNTLPMADIPEATTNILTLLDKNRLNIGNVAMNYIKKITLIKIDALLNLGENQRALDSCMNELINNGIDLVILEKSLSILDSWSKTDVSKKAEALKFCNAILEIKSDEKIETQAIGYITSIYMQAVKASKIDMTGNAYALIEAENDLVDSFSKDSITLQQTKVDAILSELKQEKDILKREIIITELETFLNTNKLKIGENMVKACLNGLTAIKVEDKAILLLNGHYKEQNIDEHKLLNELDLSLIAEDNLILRILHKKGDILSYDAMQKILDNEKINDNIKDTVKKMILEEDRDTPSTIQQPIDKDVEKSKEFVQSIRESIAKHKQETKEIAAKEENIMYRNFDNGSNKIRQASVKTQTPNKEKNERTLRRSRLL